MGGSSRLLVFALRFFAIVDLTAVGAVVMPRAWMAAIHQAVGLDAFPQAPIVDYLARTSSAMYALHGAILLFVSFDVRRYWPLIRFLALASIVHGVVVLFVDLAAGMPTLWTLVEGPCFAATGAVLFTIQSLMRKPLISKEETNSPVEPMF